MFLIDVRVKIRFSENLNGEKYVNMNLFYFKCKYLKRKLMVIESKGKIEFIGIKGVFFIGNLELFEMYKVLFFL